MEKGMILKGILILIIAVVIVIAGYFTFFNYKKCSDLNCFASYQERCRRASAINDQDHATFEYRIRRTDGKQCEISVKVLQVKEGTLDKADLEGYSMNCFVEMGSTVLPESDLSQCHGILKEKIQDVLLRNAYAQIIDNIGEIAPELKALA